MHCLGTLSRNAADDTNARVALMQLDNTPKTITDLLWATCTKGVVRSGEFIVEQ